METAIAKGSDLKVEVNGISICYDDLGTGDMPIIFIHGFPFDKSTWQPQLKYFQKTQRVIAYDVRGFGKTTAGDAVKTMSFFADDLILFMDALKIEQAIVCGLSMGGFILLNAENRFAERIKALVLCDTQCIPDSPEVKVKRHETIAKITAGGSKDFADRFIESVFCRATLNTKSELVERTRKIILSTSPETLVSGLKALENRWDMCKTLDEITKPTLVLCGIEDTVTPVAESEFLHRNIANSVLHIISKAGHLSNLEQPEEFNAHLDEFITGLNKS